jgi:uncharacterized membrane protein
MVLQNDGVQDEIVRHESQYRASVPRQTEGTAKVYEVDRVAALSDGVFAIVVTLLVLDLKLPEPPVADRSIAEELIDNIPDVAAWLLSFVALARFWMIHHHVVAGFARCRTATIVANFAFLGAISLVPFGASLVGTYEFDEPLAVVVFSATLGVSAFLLGVFTWCAAREDRRVAEPDHDLGWLIRHHVLVAPALAVLAGVVAYVHPLWTMVLWAVEASLVLTTLVSGVRRRRPGDGFAAGPPRAHPT